MYVYEEMIDGKKLTEIINETHENVKYLPGQKLPPNVVSENTKTNMKTHFSVQKPVTVFHSFYYVSLSVYGVRFCFEVIYSIIFFLLARSHFDLSIR